VDYSANYVPIYAPFNGTATVSTGVQGGKTIGFKPDNMVVRMRFMHLSQMKSGHFQEGEQIGTTGNTGKFTSAPHLHLDIATSWGGAYWTNINNFIDPETFNFGGNMGKIIWAEDVEVYFTDGQVREMSRDILQKERGASGNESWGFVQECGVYAREKYANDKTAIENLIRDSKEKVTEITLLKKKNEAQRKEYDKQLKIKKLLEEELHIVKERLVLCKAKPPQNAPQSLLEVIINWFRKENR